MNRPLPMTLAAAFAHMTRFALAGDRANAHALARRLLSIWEARVGEHPELADVVLVLRFQLMQSEDMERLSRTLGKPATEGILPEVTRVDT